MKPIQRVGATVVKPIGDVGGNSGEAYSECGGGG